MKRFSIISLLLIFAVVLSAFSVSAENSYDLIYEGADWRNNDQGGASVTLDFSSGDAVFSGSLPGTWPNIYTNYPAEKQINVAVDEYSLSYDFTVEIGGTNILLYFTNADGQNFAYTICNNSLGNVNYEAGSGDLQAGDYSGKIKLSDFVNSVKFLDNSGFDKTFIIDGALNITGVEVFSVNGAKITVRDFSIVKNGTTTEESKPAEDSSEPADESTEESAVESSEPAAEVSEEKTESSKPAESKSDITEDTSDIIEEVENNENVSVLGGWLWVIVGAAVLVAIIVAIVIVIKKKK